MRLTLLAALLLIGSLAPAPARADEGGVSLLRVPDGGLQPQAAVDARGVLHLIYFTGDPAHGNIQYRRSADFGAHWSAAVRVNSQDGSAVATGTIRGAHLAVGREGRVHVAWMGSAVAEPKGPGKEVPMLYTRLDESSAAFEPQRNVVRVRYGLDGGGSITADRDGRVYVAWHAPDKPKGSEAARRVWVARSGDDGKTFATEVAASPDLTGACGCCGMRIYADRSGRLFGLYRSATRSVHRDIYLLTSTDAAATFKETVIDPMNADTCIMSSAVMAEGPAKEGGAAGSVLGAWENKGAIEWARLGGILLTPTAVPGHGDNRKHPALAINAKGEFLLAWTERTAWGTGGDVVWQVFDAEGKPIAGRKGRAAGLPSWSLPTAFAKPDGSYGLIY